MATHGARRLLDMAANTATVVGIELLAAAQGIDFRRPLTSSKELEAVYAIVREAAEPYAEDRYFAPDIARATEGVRAGRYRAFAGDLLPSA
ncbi:Histidine ammonia-lyase [compost metagenome]